MNVDTWAVVAATLLGPIFAVQAQQWVARNSERRQRQLALFRSMMNTRVASLSQEAVAAFNAVPVEFHGHKTIMSKWNDFLDHVNTPMESHELWLTRRLDLYISLLAAISQELGYDFDASMLKKVYSPVGHAQLESDQEVIRKGIVALMKGEGTLPLEVRSIAQDKETAARLKGIQEALGAWLRGETAPRVKLDQ